MSYFMQLLFMIIFLIFGMVFRWALPPQTINIKKFFKNSENVEDQYILNVYERNVQVINVQLKITKQFVNFGYFMIYR